MYINKTSQHNSKDRKHAFRRRRSNTLERDFAQTYIIEILFVDNLLVPLQFFE